MLTVCVLLILPGILTSQVISSRSYTIKDGLPANDIEAISQDSYGQLWIGTPNGVSVFNGKTFTNYSVKDGLPNNFISHIFPDRLVPGKMWLHAGTWVCSFFDGKFTTHPIHGIAARTIYQDARGAVWCGTSRGVFIIDQDSVAVYPLPILQQNINLISAAGDSVMWFALDSIMVSVSLKTQETRKINFRGYGNGDLFGMKGDHSGNMWVTMGGSALLRIAPDGEVRLRNQQMGPSFIEFTPDDSIAWVGGLPGIGTFDAGKFPDISINEYSLETDDRNTIDIREGFIDREGNVWIGHLIHGLSRLNKTSRVVFPLGRIWNLYHHEFAASDSNGHIWVIAEGDLVEFWKDKKQAWHTYRHPFAVGNPFDASGMYGVNNAAAALTFDHAGRLWVARARKNRSVTCFEVRPESSGADSGRSRLTPVASVRFEESVLSFIVDRKNRVWANLFNKKGLAVIDIEHGNRVIRTFTEKDGFAVNYVRELLEDSRGNIWGTTFRDGVVRIHEDDLEHGTFRRFSTEDGLPEMSTFPIIEDRSGDILVGTNNGGIAIFTGDSIRAISVINGLPSNNISCMTFDWSGRLWLGTPTGFVHESIPHSWIFSNEQSFYEVEPAGCGVTKDGLLWWASLGGLSVYDYLSDPKPAIAPVIRIDDVKVNGERVDPGTTLDLSHTMNNLEIDFMGISLKDPEAIRYRYRLLGSGDRWSAPLSTPSITFASLSPGSYTFEVTAINVDDIESSAPAAVTFTIRPPYWREWWFYTPAGVAVLAVFVVVYRRRVKNLLRERETNQRFSRELIESQEEERKRVARELHDNLGQELIIIANRARKGLKAATADQAKEVLGLISKGASGALESVREIAYNLSPYHLDQVGLTGAIEGMVGNVGSLSDIRFTLRINDDGLAFPKEMEIHLYRIIQECVNNIVKHSAATEATIGFERIDGMLRIDVGDNGRGFTVVPEGKRAGVRQGFGMKGLSERVKLLRGSMSITTSNGNGTMIRILIPVHSLSPEEPRDPSGTGVAR